MITLGDFLACFKKDTNVMLYENNYYILMTNLYNSSVLENYLYKGINSCRCTHFFPADDVGCFDCLIIDLLPFPN